MCPVDLVVVQHPLQGQRHQRAELGADRDAVIGQLRIALVRHRGTAHRSRRRRLARLGQFGLHQLKDLQGDPRPGRAEQAEQAHVLGEAVDDRPGRHRHRHQVQPGRDRILHRGASRAQRGESADRAAGHRDEHPALRRPQPGDMSDELIDPPGRLEPERDRDCVLAVRSSRRQHARGALGQVCGGAEHPGQQPQDLPVGLAQHQNVTGLRDVLRGRSPVHPPPMLTSRHGQLGDQGHQRMAGLGDATLDPGHVQARQPGRRRYRLRRRNRNDPALRLGRRQGSLHIQPALPAVLPGEQRPHARVRNPSISEPLSHLPNQPPAAADGKAQPAEAVRARSRRRR